MLRPLIVTLLFLSAASGCESQHDEGAAVRDAGDAAAVVEIAFDGTHYTVKPGAGVPSLTGLHWLAAGGLRSGTLAVADLKKGVYATIPKAGDQRLGFIAAFEAGDKVCYPSEAGGGKLIPAAGISFSGKIPVTCVLKSDYDKEAAGACAELAADPSVAKLDASGSCLCLKRKASILTLADYHGQPDRLRLDCRNAATKEELRALCTELRDRSCKTCKVDENSCDCPNGKTFLLAGFAGNVESFRAACGGG